MIWLISDSHLLHERIQQYCSRPPDWQEKFIKNWNGVVEDNDWVVHLGDFIFGKAFEVSEYAHKLRGHKAIVIGNHDKKIDKKTPFENLGFSFVFRNHGDSLLLPLKEKEIEVKFILVCHAVSVNPEEVYISHWPVYDQGGPYAYGHVHNNPLAFDNKKIFYDFTRLKGRNVCVEMTNYELLPLPALLGDMIWIQENVKPKPRSFDQVESEKE